MERKAVNGQSIKNVLWCVHVSNLSLVGPLGLEPRIHWLQRTSNRYLYPIGIYTVSHNSMREQEDSFSLEI